MNKLEKIDLEAQKAREKIAAMQSLLKQIEGQRTEQENLQIVQQFRALKLSRDELYAFLNSGEIPPALTGAAMPATEPETIYSRREKPSRHEQSNDITNTESEGIDNEE